MNGSGGWDIPLCDDFESSCGASDSEHQHTEFEGSDVMPLNLEEALESLIGIDDTDAIVEISGEQPATPQREVDPTPEPAERTHSTVDTWVPSKKRRAIASNLDFTLDMNSKRQRSTQAPQESSEQRH